MTLATYLTQRAWHKPATHTLQTHVPIKTWSGGENKAVSFLFLLQQTNKKKKIVCVWFWTYSQQSQSGFAGRHENMSSKLSQAMYEIGREILSSKLCEIFYNKIKTLEKQVNNIYSKVELNISVSSSMGTIKNIVSLGLLFYCYRIFWDLFH